MHPLHVAGGLQVMAARIKTDAFTHQSHGTARVLYSPSQMHNSGVFLLAALGNGDKSPRTHLAQLLKIEVLILPVLDVRKLLQAVAYSVLASIR